MEEWAAATAVAACAGVAPAPQEQHALSAARHTRTSASTRPGRAIAPISIFRAEPPQRMLMRRAWWKVGAPALMSTFPVALLAHPIKTPALALMTSLLPSALALMTSLPPSAPRSQDLTPALGPRTHDHRTGSSWRTLTRRAWWKVGTPALMSTFPVPHSKSLPSALGSHDPRTGSSWRMLMPRAWWR